MADYFKLLKRAVESLPRSTPHAREEVYHRARMSLVSQLRESPLAIPEAAIAGEQHALNDAIQRLEAHIKKEMQELTDNTAVDRHDAPIESDAQETSAAATPLRPVKAEPPSPAPKPSGWLSDLLARASRVDENRPAGLSVAKSPAPETKVGASEPRPLAAPESRLSLAPEPKRFSLQEASPIRSFAPASPAVAVKDLDGVPPRDPRLTADANPKAAPVPPAPPFVGEKRLSVPRPGQPSFNQHTPQERPMSRLDELNRVLRKLQSDSPGIEASALISEDGLMIASALPPGMEEARVAGMTATLLNLGSRGAVELNRGSVQEIIVRGERGYAVLISAGRGALLLALTDESSKLGLVFFDMREAIRAVQKVL
jgi:predicted regulator of Ras-like GTPase activity (Roadblock/LC7/MglB family)